MLQFVVGIFWIPLERLFCKILLISALISRFQSSAVDTVVEEVKMFSKKICLLDIWEYENNFLKEYLCTFHYIMLKFACVHLSMIHFYLN